MAGRRRFGAASSSSSSSSSGEDTSMTTGSTQIDGSRAVHPAVHIDLSRPRHDQSTYWGRARHFVETANPLNILAGPAKLNEAARIVNTYKSVTQHHVVV